MQWLQIKRIQFISPDGQLFPTFNDKLRASMLKETELFMESIFREDRSVLDLIDADFTFLNEPLARHYGIADTNGNLVGQKPTKPGGKPIRGMQFQRVKLQDRTRGGLLTQTSVLTVTSNPTRTSPVKRRPVGARANPGRSPAAPAAECAGTTGEGERCHRIVIASADGGSPSQPGLRQLPCQDGPDRVRPGEFQCGGRFRTKDGTSTSTRPANSRMERSSAVPAS